MNTSDRGKIWHGQMWRSLLVYVSTVFSRTMMGIHESRNPFLRHASLTFSQEQNEALNCITSLGIGLSHEAQPSTHGFESPCFRKLEFAAFSSKGQRAPRTTQVRVCRSYRHANRNNFILTPTLIEPWVNCVDFASRGT